jgi:hypothetical protein
MRSQRAASGVDVVVGVEVAAGIVPEGCVDVGVGLAGREVGVAVEVAAIVTATVAVGEAVAVAVAVDDFGSLSEQAAKANAKAAARTNDLNADMADVLADAPVGCKRAAMAARESALRFRPTEAETLRRRRRAIRFRAAA